MDGEPSTGCSDNLLLLRARKLPEYRVRNRCRGLDCERVHKHTRGRSHLAGPESTRLEHNMQSSVRKVALRRGTAFAVLGNH